MKIDKAKKSELNENQTPEQPGEKDVTTLDDEDLESVNGGQSGVNHNPSQVPTSRPSLKTLLDDAPKKESFMGG